VPPSLTTPCPTLPTPAGPELADIVTTLLQVAEDYHDCAARHRALADLVTEKE